MQFKYIMSHLWHGKWVYRSSWPKGRFLFFDGKHLQEVPGGAEKTKKVDALNTETLRADDWEVMK